MKQPGTLLEHAGEEFLCIEGGFNVATRTVTLLVDAASPTFPHRDEDSPITWRDQGDWYPVARWSAGEVLLPDPRHHEQSTLAGDVITHYLDEHPELPEAAWAVAEGEGYRGHLVDILPQGVAAELHEDLEAAQDAADGAELVAVHDIPRFLTYLAREGYAGALWNGAQPVFFCLDEEDELQFLRVGDGGGGKVAMEILDPLESWMSYEGAEEIDMLDNAEACDARLVEAVGRLPLLGWPDDGTLFSLGPDEEHPGVVTVSEDGLDYALLFADEDECKEWITEEVKEPWVCWPIHDLAGFLSLPGLEKGGAVLNPGGHRARRGVLWHDGERIVLDSFSGFWELEDEGFSLIAEADYDGEADVEGEVGSEDEPEAESGD
jgi:hypothetical protein